MLFRSDRYRNNYKTAAVLEDRAGSLKPQAKEPAINTAAQRVSQFLRERKGR